MGDKRKSAVAIALTGLVVASAPLTSAWAEDVPNTIALRKVAEARYNLSINLLDEYADQEVGIRIRRVTGTVSEIITLPSKVLGAEGRGAFVINQKLEPDDVFLFTQANVVIYKVALREATVIDVTNPEQPVTVVFESSTAQLGESSTAIIDHPNDVATRVLSGKRYLMSINLLDRYAGQEIVIERVRKVSGKAVRAEIARKVLGAFGKVSVVIAGEAKVGDLFVISRGGVELFSFRK